jgi:hypothetical protein
VAGRAGESRDEPGEPGRAGESRGEPGRAGESRGEPGRAGTMLLSVRRSEWLTERSHQRFCRRVRNDSEPSERSERDAGVPRKHALSSRLSKQGV